MIDRPRVEDLLSRLSATGYGDGARVAGRGGRTQILRGVLRELDAAVLPRILSFGGADGPLIQIEAANRRVLGFGSIGEEMSEISADNNDGATALRGFLEEGLAGVSKLYVSQATPSVPMDAMGAGLSAVGLAEAWDLSLAPVGFVDHETAIDTLMAKAGDGILAWMIELEDESNASGDPDAVEMLEALAASDRAADLLGVTAGEEPWQFVAVANPASETVATVLARVGEIRMLLALPQDKLAEMANLWNEVMTG